MVGYGDETVKNLISFTINGIEYQAEEGMTYGEWHGSEYNTGFDEVIHGVDNSTILEAGKKYITLF
jgi:hypothetical protein